MKVTAKQAVAGLQLVSEEGLTGRLMPFVEVNRRNRPITAGSIIKVVETPRNYEGCGRSVKFTVGNNLVNRFAFWSDFKTFTNLP